MREFETYPKKWGNSLGVTIPQDILLQESITKKDRVQILILKSDPDRMKKIFGTLRFKKSTQKIMDEIDEGYD